jgi:acyl-CoA thioesterase-1
MDGVEQPMKASGRVIVAVLLSMIMGGTMIADAPAQPNRASESWDLFAPTVAQAPDGTIWAAWVANTGTGREIVTSRGDGDSWEAVEVAVANPGRWDATPNLAIDANGVAWLAWSSSTEGDDTLHLSHWTDQGWSTPQELPGWDTVPNRQPVLAPTPDGGLWLAWVGFDGNDDEIYAARWDGTSWSQTWQVSDDDTDPTAYDTQPRLGVGRNGSVWAAWTGHEDFLDDEIFASRWDGEHWAPPERVSADDDDPDEYPSLAVASDGTAWLAWDGPVPEAAGEWRIHVSRWTPSDGWNEEVIVSSPLHSAVSDERPSLALDSRGLPRIGWHLRGGAVGLGYAEFDGSEWSPPRWAVQDAVGEAVVLLDDDRPLLLGTPVSKTVDAPFRSWLPDKSSPLVPVVDSRAQAQVTPPGLVANRHVAFGDSITWGQYIDFATGELVGDYPARLEVMLDSRVTPSEVVNDGLIGEKTADGKWRILLSSDTYHPEFMEIMEGTNDVTGGRPYEGIASNLQKMVNDIQATGTRPLLATLLPRCDGKYGSTATMNEEIAAVAARKGVPLVDNWQAFHDYPGGWQALLRPAPDCVHPNTQGMAVLAESWYDGILSSVPWLEEDTTPPDTWIDSVGSECGEALVEWDGSDNTSWVADYDVQSNLNSAGWTDWLLETEENSAFYRDGADGDSVGFRVRGRDVIGNPSEYGDSSPVYTTLHDTLDPEVEMHTLPPAMKAPFSISWLGEDKCGPVTGFDIEFSAGTPYNWQPWLTDTTNTSGVFDPSSPQYGKTYYFHVRARDAAAVPNESDWSDPVSTYLAKYVLSGQVYTVRGLPVMKAEMDTAPIVPVVMDRIGSYEAYLPGGGDYELTASRDGFGTLPPMHRAAVSADMDGLDLVLPPLDDVVSDGGFEAGTWGDWQAGGTYALTSESHTGDGAVLLGGLGATSTLGQPLSVPGTLTNATLSFLVRLNSGGGSSTLQVSVVGTPISHTQVVSTTDWTHVWLPVDAAVGQPVTLTFTVSNSAAVRLDEVSLGTARHGGGVTFLPIVQQNQSP